MEAAEWAGGAVAAAIVLAIVYKAYNGGWSVNTRWGMLHCRCGPEESETEDLTNREVVQQISEIVTALSTHVSKLAILLTEQQERQADLQADAIDALRINIRAGSESDRGSDL